MASINFGPALRETLRWEGKFVDHPRDPGGRTAYGVTQAVYDAFRRDKGQAKKDVYGISEVEKREIYYTRYWLKVSGDFLPDGLDLVAFDGAVNSGVSRGARWLQQGLGIKADGKVGGETVNAAVAAKDRVAVVKRACAARMGFLRSLRTFSTFGRGWSRRVAGIEAAASVMAAPNKAQAKTYALLEANRSDKAAKGQNAGATVSGSAGAGNGLTVDPTTLDLNSIAPWIALGLTAALIVLAVFLAARARRNKDRAAAFAEAVKSLGETA